MIGDFIKALTTLRKYTGAKAPVYFNCDTIWVSVPEDHMQAVSDEDMAEFANLGFRPDEYGIGFVWGRKTDV